MKRSYLNNVLNNVLKIGYLAFKYKPQEREMGSFKYGFVLEIYKGIEIWPNPEIRNTK